MTCNHSDESMRKIILVLVFGLIVSTPMVFAQKESMDLPPRLILPGDIYVNSKVPTPVNFIVKATDDFDKNVSIQCDKSSGSVFKIGKTTVRCAAEDSARNKRMGSFVVTVGYEIAQIPQWVKKITKFWVQNSIDDQTYSQTIGFLIGEKILKVPVGKISGYNEAEIPKWIKTNAQYWVEGKISDDSFSIMLQWLINRGMIKI